MRTINKISIFLFASVFCSFLNIQAQDFGKAIKLNGTSNYITIPNVSNYLETSNFTFECWSKRNSSASVFAKDRIIMSILSGGWGVFIEGNRLKLTKVGNSETNSVKTIADTFWHHLAVTHDGTTATFYIDGVLDTALPFAKAFTSTGSYSIGSRGAGEYYGGTLDEIRIWNKVKTATEIAQQKCTILTGTESGLRAYYKFNEGTGTSIVDQTTNAINGTITDGTNLWVGSTVACTSPSGLIEKSNKSSKFNAIISNNMIQINLSEAFSNVKEIQVYDVAGILVYSKRIDATETQIIINTDNLPLGMYILKMNSDELNYTEKIMITK